VLQQPESSLRRYPDPADTDTTSIKTFARREGDKYIVNGQKIWISCAEHSDLLLLLARTTPKEQRQECIFLSSLLADFIDTRDRIQASLSDHDAFRQSAIQLIDVAEAHAAGIDSATVETLLMVVFYSAKTLNLSNG